MRTKIASSLICNNPGSIHCIGILHNDTKLETNIDMGRSDILPKSGSTYWYLGVTFVRLEVCNLNKELASWALFLHWVIMLLLMLEQGLP